jgi:glutamate/aspartate transport system substrate-binding protein
MTNWRLIRNSLFLLSLLAGLSIVHADAQEFSVLKKIRETGVVVIGHRIGSIPFSYLDGKLKPVGYTIDLCQRVVESIATTLKRKLTIKLVAVTPATRIPLVVNGTVDLECGVTTNTLERQKSEAFTMTIFVAQSRLLGKKSSNIQSLNDLRGKTVVSTAATTNIQYLNEINAAQQLKLKILVGKDDAESFQMVETDRAVAYAMDDVLLYSLVASSQNQDQFLISTEPLSVEPYGIALTKHDPEFKKLVDSALVKIFKSGEIHTIYRKWFQSPIVPKGINLQLPMNAALANAIAAPTDSGDPTHYSSLLK